MHIYILLLSFFFSIQWEAALEGVCRVHIMAKTKSLKSIGWYEEGIGKMFQVS